MAGIVAAIGGGYITLTRGARGAWVWPLWIVLSVAPVTDVIATPHSGYLCGVGFAVGAALAATSARKRWLRGLGRAALCFYLVAMSVFTLLNRWQWTAIIAAERYATAWVQAAPPEPEVRDVFFMNLPFVNIYAKPALDRMLGPEFSPVRCHVLSFAPDPILIEQRVWLTQVDGHTLRLRIDGQPFFSRLLGRFLIDGFRGGGPFVSGDVIHGDEFDARVVAADTEGVQELEFTFRRPLSDPAYCFYLGSSEAPAARIRFRAALESPGHSPEVAAPAEALVSTLAQRLADGSADAGHQLLELARKDAQLRASAEVVMGPLLRPLTAMLGAPTQRLLDGPTRSASDWDALAEWWGRWMDDRALRELWAPRPGLAHYIKEREEAPHARIWAAKVIRSDLYLTGPPFPGPRRAVDRR
jgi:hypothetical protein